MSNFLAFIKKGSSSNDNPLTLPLWDSLSNPGRTPAAETQSTSAEVISRILEQEPNPGDRRDQLILSIIADRGGEIINSNIDAMNLLVPIQSQDIRALLVNKIVEVDGNKVVKNCKDACKLLRLLDYESHRASIVPKILQLEGIKDAQGVHEVCLLLDYESHRFNALNEVISRRGSTLINSADDALKLLKLLDYESNRASIVPKILRLEGIKDAQGVRAVCLLLDYESHRFNALNEVISRRGSTLINRADDALKLLKLVDYETNKIRLLGQILKVGSLNDVDRSTLKSKFGVTESNHPQDRTAATARPYIFACIDTFNLLVKVGQAYGVTNLTPLAISQDPIDKEALRLTYRQLAILFHPDTAPEAIRSQYDLNSYSQALRENYLFLKENLPTASQSSLTKVSFRQVDSAQVTQCSFSYSDSERIEAIKQAEILATKDLWTLQDLLSAFKGSLMMKCPLPMVPQYINFHGMKRTILGLSHQTGRDNRERGKNVYVNFKTKQLIAGTTSLGDADSVTVKSRVPSDYVEHISAEILDIHTHPATPHNKDEMLHFSPQDLKSSVKSNNVGSLVIAGNKALFVLKSSKSKDYDKVFGSLQSWWDEISSGTSQVYTQKACKSLGFTLYLLDFGNNDWIARQIDLEQGDKKSYKIKNF